MASPQAVRLFEQIYAKIDAQVRDIVNSMLPNVSVAAQDDGAVVANDHRILNFQGDGVTVTDDSARRRVNVLIPGAPVVTSQSVFVSAPGSEQAYDNGTSGTGPTGWYTAAYNHFGTGWTASVADTSGIAGMPTPPSSSSYVTKSSAVQPSNERFLFWRTFTLPSNTVISANLLIVQDNFLEQLYINGTAVAADATANGVIQTLSISPSLFIPGAANGLAIQVRNEVAGASNVMRMAYRLEVNFGAGGTDSQYELVARKGVANGYAGLDASTHVPTAQLGSGTASSSTFLRGDQTWSAGGSGMTNPMTTQDDIIVGGSSGTPARLAKGTDGQVLTIDTSSHHVTWATPSGGGGSGLDKLLLNYREASDLASAASVSATTWTNVGTSKSFTVTDASATIELRVGGYFMVGHATSAISAALAVVIDSGTRYTVGGCRSPANEWCNPCSGSIALILTGLSAAAHTVQVQFQQEFAGSWYLIPATQPNYFSFSIVVWQRAAS